MDPHGPSPRPDSPYNPRPVLPDLTVLLALVLGLNALHAPAGEEGPGLLQSAGGTLALVLVVLGLTRMAVDRSVRAIGEADRDAAIASARRIEWWPTLGWLVALFAFDWGTLVAARVPRVWFLARYVVLFAPYALMVGAAWVGLQRIEAAALRTPPSWKAGLARGLRRNGLVLLPMGILLAIQEVLVVLDELSIPALRPFFLWMGAVPELSLVLVLGVLVLVTWFAPALIRRVLKATPFPAGATRDRVLSLCAAVGVRVKDILLWNTGGTVLNAMVVGLSARTRYVFVTDGLLAALPGDELLAVLAHEAGHAKHRHLVAFLVVSISLMLLEMAAGRALGGLLPGGADTLLTVASLALFWFGVLGWLSRRFERQSDVFGAEHGAVLTPDAPSVELPSLSAPVPAGAASMMKALQRIQSRVGPGRSHRHGSPSERIAYLGAWATKPEVREAQERDRRRIGLGIWVLVALALGTTALHVPGGLVRGRAALAFARGIEHDARAEAARRRGDAAGERAAAAESRIASLEAASRLRERPDDPDLRELAALAEWNAADAALHHLRADAEARAGFERLLSILEPARDTAHAELRFQARIDLGRLALRVDGPPAAAVAAATRRLQEAAAIPEGAYGGRYRRARLRLLESAIRLRDADPAVAAQARRDLERQAQGSKDDDDRWEELARDAAEELALAPR